MLLGRVQAALAIGMCLAQNPNPFSLNKSNLGSYCKNGSSTSKASLHIQNWATNNWTPYGSIESLTHEGYTDTPEGALSVIAGLTEVHSLRKKDWDKMFEGITLDFKVFATALVGDFDYPIPEESDFEKKNYSKKDTKIRAFLEYVSRLYLNVQISGVADVIEKQKELRRIAKASWADAASGDGSKIDYGDKKAETWQPQGWLPEHDALSSEDITDNLAACQANIDALKQMNAVDEHKKSQWEEEISKKDGFIKEVEILVAAETEKKQERKECVAEYTNNTRINERNKIQDEISIKTKEMNDLHRLIQNIKVGKNILACPCCQANLILNNNVLEEHVEENNGDQVEVHSKAIATLKVDMEECQKKVDVVQRDINEKYTAYNAKISEIDKVLKLTTQNLATARYAIRNCEQSEKNLVAYNENEEAGSEIEGSLADYEVKLDELKKLRSNFSRLAKTKAANMAVIQHTSLINSLTKGRVYQEMNKVGAASVGSIIKNIGKKFLNIELELQDSTVTYNGRAIQFASESEKWEASFVVQRALASYFKVPMMVVDRYDVLDEYKRDKFNGALNNLTGKRGFTTVICGVTNESQNIKENIDIILK